MALDDVSKMSSTEDAENLYQATKDADPFPHIPPALLNSADIHDYIEATGMVYPYSAEFMKSSSYEAQIGERAIYWDENGQKTSVSLTKACSVKLAPNSLVFFETKQVFRLPPYMAIRFNLRITNVHRGLLLGTGPLVDPGFCGKLLIPIHNLTNNTYTFRGGEKFIWVEFTKVSPHADWDKGATRISEQCGNYKPFPEDKKYKSPSDYFEKANNGNRIQNAVPEALFEAKKSAGAAQDKANQAAVSADAAEKAVRNYSRLFTFGGALALLVAAVGIYLTIPPLITDSTNLSKDVSITVSEFRKEYSEHLAKEISAQIEIDALNERITNLQLGKQIIDHMSRQQSKFDALEKQVDALQNELNYYKALQALPNPPSQKSQ